MPTLATDDGVKLHYEETGSGTPIVFVHEFGGDHRSWEPQVRHFSRRYRCIAYNARGYPPSDVPEDFERYSQARARDDIRCVLDALGIAARARRRPVDGRVRHAAFRHDLRPPRALDHRRGRRLRLAPGAVPPVPGRLEEERRAHQARGHGALRRDLRPRPAARAARDQGSARLRRVPAPVQGALGARRDEHAARRAVPPAVVLRPDRGNGAHGRADAHHVGRRGGALHRGQPADEAHHPDRRARAPAAQRARHQPGGAGAVQPAARGLPPPGRDRALRQARPALDGPFDLRARRGNPERPLRGREERRGRLDRVRPAGAAQRHQRRDVARHRAGDEAVRRRSGGALRRVSRRGHRGFLGRRRYLGVRNQARR